jgi:hypothetical protein
VRRWRNLLFENAAVSCLERVTLEDPALTAKSFEWKRSGLDFADALHPAKAEGCEAFISFDRRLAAAANGLGDVTIRAP